MSDTTYIHAEHLRQHLDIIRQEQQVCRELLRKVQSIRQQPVPGGEYAAGDAYRRVKDLWEYFQSIEKTVDTLCDSTVRLQQKNRESWDDATEKTKRLFY